MDGIGVGMEKTNGNDIDALSLAAESLDQLPQNVPVEGLQHTPLGIESLWHAKDQRRFDKWTPSWDENVVQLRANLAANAEHVLESGGCHQGHSRPLAFEHGIGGHG